MEPKCLLCMVAVAFACPPAPPLPMCCMRHALQDKERLFDLQTPERRRIESFESQVSWLRVASPEELQVGVCSAGLEPWLLVLCSLAGLQPWLCFGLQSELACPSTTLRALCPAPDTNWS